MNTNWYRAERQQFVTRLNAVDRILVTGYRLLLGLVIAAVAAVVVLVIIWRPWGAGNQGEWFYFSVTVLFVVGWAIGQFIKLDRRPRRQQSLATFHVTASGAEDGARKWDIRFGPAAAERQQSPLTGNDDVGLSFSRSFEVPLASLPATVVPDNQALACLQAEVNRGTDLDEACALVEPAYADWNLLERAAYRQCVTNMLDRQRNANAGE